MAKASKATVQVKKKRWCTIVAPKLFNEMPLGETYVLEPKDAIGKPIRVSVMQITGEPQKQYISAGFVITDIVGDRLQTTIKSYKILPSALRRLVRRAKDKFEDSMIVTCADGRLVRIKPFVVTRYKTKGGIMTGLRKATRETIVRLAASVTAEQLFVDVITSKLQRALHDIIRKTYPIGACEIRWLEILPGMGTKPVLPPAPAEVKPEVKEEAHQAEDAAEEDAEDVAEAAEPAAETPEEIEEPEDDADAEPAAGE